MYKNNILAGNCEVLCPADAEYSLSSISVAVEELEDESSESPIKKKIIKKGEGVCANFCNQRASSMKCI